MYNQGVRSRRRSLPQKEDSDSDFTPLVDTANNAINVFLIYNIKTN